MFEFNEAYRASDEYKMWVASIQKDYPDMSLYLIEQAIIAHKTDPQAYKKDKNAKKVFSDVPKPYINPKTEVVKGAITVEDAPLEDDVSKMSSTPVVIEELN